MNLFVLIVVGIAVFVAVSWIGDNVRRAHLYSALKPRLDKLDANEAHFAGEKAAAEQRLKRDQIAVQQLAKEKSEGFPWLADAYSQYFELQDLATASYLEHKLRPAKRAAEHVREVARERRKAEKLWRVLRYQIEYYETLFPWLVDFKGEDLDDLVRQLTTDKDSSALIAEDDDPVRHWLTASEYASFSTAQKNQLALERYWQKKKSPWEIGRDYERYIGYQYESKGWHVTYQGIIAGFEDLGRDLIATNGAATQVVQCKYWSKHKTIHEKHIFQLYGTVVAYQYDHPHSATSGVFVTSTLLSERAKGFAAILHISCRESMPFSTYPSIKCNIARTNNAKIYHLPMDQQYDRTVIEQERHERYVSTVAEAEGLGFRRAYRWHGESDDQED